MSKRKAKQVHKPKKVSKIPQPSIQLERPDANTRMRLIVVPHFPAADPRSNIVRPPEGGPGSYRATLVLGVPGKEVFRNELQTSQIMQSGESLLQIPPRFAALQVKLQALDDDQQAEMLFSTNPKKMISKIHLRITAQNFEEAERTAHNFALPILSYWSYRHDVALDVTGYEVVEEQTESRKWQVDLTGKVKPFQVDELNKQFLSKRDYLPVLAAYREGMNATNSFYQVLYFYKVIEGIRKLREQRRRLSRMAMQYYIAGRFAFHAHFLPVAGNLLHHAIEMYLKGALSEWLPIEKLQDILHNLPKLWEAFKHKLADPELDAFDAVINELHRFESLRYPNRILSEGGALTISIRGGTRVVSEGGSLPPLPAYDLVLEDVDKLAKIIFAKAHPRHLTFFYSIPRRARPATSGTQQLLPVGRLNLL